MLQREAGRLLLSRTCGLDTRSRFALFLDTLGYCACVLGAHNRSGTAEPAKGRQWLTKKIVVFKIFVPVVWIQTHELEEMCLFRSGPSGAG